MKILKLAYSLLAYVFFLGVFHYLVLFLGANFLADWLPILASLKTIDTGEAYFELSFLPVWLGNAVFSSYAYATTGVPTSVVLFSLLTLIIIVSAILYVLIRFCKGPKKKPKDFDSRYISIEMVSKRSRIH